MTLFIKMIRDIWEAKTQFLAILIMVSIGVLIFSGLDSIRQGFLQEKEGLYAATNLPDLWLYTLPLDGAEIDLVAELDEVEAVEPRFNLVVSLGKSKISLFIGQNSKLALPYLVSGSSFDGKKEGIWLDQSFAKANGYEAGDRISLLGQDLIVEGLVLSGEAVYFPDLNSTVPNFNEYGYAYLSNEVGEKLLGDVGYNQLLIKIKEGEEYTLVLEKLKTVLDYRFLGAVERDDLPSIKVVDDKIDQLAKFTYIFPFIFFLLALLTMLTTMIRMVENQRLQIGTLMALGYGKHILTWHYVSYGLWMGVLGGALGLFSGRRILSAVLLPMFKNIFVLPKWSAPLTLGGFMSVLVILGCCFLVVLCSVRGKLKDLPAVTLQGKTEQRGRKVFGEGFVTWKKFSLETKSTLRNIGKNKIRSTMGIIGVLGCMMLILAAFGQNDSLELTLDLLVSEDYEYKVQMTEEVGLEDIMMLSSDAQAIQEGTLKLLVNGQEQMVVFTVLDQGSLGQPTGYEGIKIELKDNGLAITEQLASVLEVEQGDLVDVQYQGMEAKTLELSSFIKIPMSQNVYLTRQAWEQAGYVFNPTAVLFPEMEQSLADFVGKQGIIKKGDQKEAAKEHLKPAKTIASVLGLGAIVLGITVIYNLGLLNYTEMSRQYATLKVLGFYPREIRIMALKEHSILTVVGYLLGIPAGYLFLKIYMETISNDSQAIFINLQFSSFIKASLITLCCAFGVNLFLGRKINEIDMVTSLKGVE